MVVIVIAVCFYLHPKEQLTIIAYKIEQRLQMGRRQQNYIGYNQGYIDL